MNVVACFWVFVLTYLLTTTYLLTYLVQTLSQNSAFAMSVVRLRRPRVWNGV